MRISSRYNFAERFKGYKHILVLLSEILAFSVGHECRLLSTIHNNKTSLNTSWLPNTIINLVQALHLFCIYAILFEPFLKK